MAIVLKARILCAFQIAQGGARALAPIAEGDGRLVEVATREKRRRARAVTVLQAAHGNVSVAGNKNKLLFPSALNQSLLEIDPIYAGHLHIDNDADWSRMRWTR